jgi:hypothetical protein
LHTKYLAADELQIFICNECRQLFFDASDKLEHKQLTGPSFKPSIWSQVGSLEELDNNAQGMYRMMRSLEKRGLVARLLHRRPAVWYHLLWQDGRPKLEPGSYGWYDFNHVMYRDGQVLIQTKGKIWIMKGAKMSSAQIKRRIEQQIRDMEKGENKLTIELV